METSIGDEGPAGIAFLFDDLTVRRTLRNGTGWLGRGRGNPVGKHQIFTVNMLVQAENGNLTI
jgi:hypothetical protein